MFRAAAAALCLAAFALPASAADYVPIPGGSFASVLPPDGKAAPASVAPFRLRSLPVTNAEFLDFVRANPRWQRGRIALLFADSQYLVQWNGPLNLGAAGRNQPVTRVSWFAAEAFCESEHARLPTWYEFEFAAAADESTRAPTRPGANAYSTGMPGRRRPRCPTLEARQTTSTACATCTA